MDALWVAFIAACALAGIGLTVLWIRVQRSGDPELEELEEQARRIAKRQRRRGGPPQVRRRTPPPTPDLVSVQQAWADLEEDKQGRLITNVQRSGTPTHPSGPRAGGQVPIGQLGVSAPPQRAVQDVDPEVDEDEGIVVHRREPGYRAAPTSPVVRATRAPAGKKGKDPVE